MAQVEHLVTAQCELGEGPLWHPVEQVLYWVDILKGRLHRYDPRSDAHSLVELGLITSAMGVRAKGGFVMATKKGFALWDPEAEKFTFIGDPDADQSAEARFNDGKTDRQGRFWAGKMSEQPTNSLFRLDPDGSIQRMESGIKTSNGLGWSPDNRTFYYTDTPKLVIYAYDFDPDSGELSNRRVFAEVPKGSGEGFPDGLAVDAQGYVWSARWGGWKLVRYAPDGSLERTIPMPIELPTSCAFGGPDLSELYITSAWTAVKPENRTKQPWAGDVFRLKTDVQGLPEPFFAG